jgi:hypothetical protein
MSASTLDADDQKKDMRLVVDVTARLDWRLPPKDENERIMRESASQEANACAHEIRDAVYLLVAILLTKRR